MLADMNGASVILLDFSPLHHGSQDLSSGFVAVTVHAGLRELLLKLGNLVRLLEGSKLSQILHLVLTTNVDLLTTSLAASLKQVGASPLQSYNRKRLQVSYLQERG